MAPRPSEAPDTTKVEGNPVLRLARKVRRSDPRYFQMSAQFVLLVAGILFFEFQVKPAHAVTYLAAALAAQALFSRIFRIPFDYRSALITGLSLSLLLRTNDPLIAAAAAAAGIGSKFLIRFRGRHIFNPSTFGIVAMLLLTGGAWVSPGQWGTELWLGFLCICLGGLVLVSAARLDIALAFLGAYAGMLLARALWLGDPLAIPLHQMQSGTLLLFTFFMITDPRTTPLTLHGRIVFAVLTAALAMGFRFVLYMPEAVFYALFLTAPLTPLIDRFLPGRPHQWPGARPSRHSQKNEVPHAPRLEPATP